MTDHVISTAEFNPKVRTYWLLSGALVLAATVVGIPFLLLWFPIGLIVTQRYLDRMSCVLTDRSLIVGRGILNRVEKTIPLDKITDVALRQGPIMRMLELEGLSVETAGQSGQGALVTLVGIRETRKFRDTVLQQRDLLRSGPSESAAAPRTAAAAATGSADALLLEIRDSLHRIESHLEKG